MKKVAFSVGAGTLVLATFSGTAAGLPLHTPGPSAPRHHTHRSAHAHRHARKDGSNQTGASPMPMRGHVVVPHGTVPAPATAAASGPQVAPELQPPLPALRGEATAWGCGAALAYLDAYAAPGFTFECPGYASGHQAMTCVDDPPYCGVNQRIIAISDPCPAAYMNEASNSWVLIGESNAAIDPYGYCG